MAAGARRVAVFIDGSNTYYTMRDTLRWAIDWKRFRYFLDGLGQVTDCIYYVGRSDEMAQGQESFLNMLAYSGYSLVMKDLKTIITADGSAMRKANLDVEIAVDMLARAEAFDAAVLVSGDGDLERPLQFLRDRGKDVYVISANGRVAQELRWFVGPNFIDLEQIREDIERGSQEY